MYLKKSLRCIVIYLIMSIDDVWYAYFASSVDLALTKTKFEKSQFKNCLENYFRRVTFRWELLFSAEFLAIYTARKMDDSWLRLRLGSIGKRIVVNATFRSQVSNNIVMLSFIDFKYEMYGCFFFSYSCF